MQRMYVLLAIIALCLLAVVPTTAVATPQTDDPRFTFPAVHSTNSFPDSTSGPETICFASNNQSLWTFHEDWAAR